MFHFCNADNVKAEEIAHIVEERRPRTPSRRRSNHQRSVDNLSRNRERERERDRESERERETERVRERDRKRVR